MRKSNFVARPVQCFPVFNSFLLLNNMFGCNDIMMNDSDWMSVDRLFCQSLLLTNTSFSPKIFRPLRTFCLHFFFAAKTSHHIPVISSSTKTVGNMGRYLLFAIDVWRLNHFGLYLKTWRWLCWSEPKVVRFSQKFSFPFPLVVPPLVLLTANTESQQERDARMFSRTFVCSFINW